MSHMDKPQLPEASLVFVQRIWHVRLGRYLYAKDYNLKGFPLRKRKR